MRATPNGAPSSASGIKRLNDPPCTTALGQGSKAVAVLEGLARAGSFRRDSVARTPGHRGPLGPLH
eukprot:183448-Alexandrium_andersonii.AAC.1